MIMQEKVYIKFSSCHALEKKFKRYPIVVCQIEWGGHWQVVIGYDDMGAETTQDDVMIMADPYDTTDYNQDGYFIYGAERFYYNQSIYDFFAEEGNEDYERNAFFVLAKPE